MDRCGSLFRRASGSACAALSLTLAGVLLSAAAAVAEAPSSSVDPAVAHAALSAAAAASNRAGARGWKATVNRLNGSVVITRDTLRRRVHETHPGEPTWEYFAAEGVGSYDRLTDTTAPPAALEQLARPAAQFEFAPDRNFSLTVERGSDAYVAPTGDLGPVGALKATIVTSATLNVLADGTKVYKIIGSLRGGSGTAIVHISPDGTVSQTVMDLGPGSPRTLQNFSYTGTEVTLPNAADCVTNSALERAVAALKLPATLKAQAKGVATGADAHAKSVGRRSTTSTDIVNAARKFATIHALEWHPVRTTTRLTRTGATLTAINPFTHRSLTYTIILMKGKAAART